jgi:ribosomal protein L37AE/L43A
MNKNNEPNAGWKQIDEWYLNRHDNKHEPVFIQEDFEEQNKERREYFCAICKTRLDFLKETGTIWRCNACMQYYDTSIQDIPLKNIKESRVKTFPELSKYPTYDESDVYLPFVQGIDPDAETSIPDVEVLRDDGRIKHIRVKGLPTEALAVMDI